MKPEVIPRIPATLQMVINCHPGDYHLFEREYDEFPMIWPGMLLVDVPGVPNVVGPDAEFDNRIVKIAYSGKTQRMLCQVHGARYATDTIDEVKKDLPEWKYIRQVEHVKDADKFTG